MSRRGAESLRADDEPSSRRQQRPSRATAATGVGGRRLAAAFDAVTGCRPSRRPGGASIGLCERQAPSLGELAEAIESDAALAIAVMRAANNGGGPLGPGRRRARGGRGRCTPTGVAALAARSRDLRRARDPGLVRERHERFRRHAVAVRIAAERIAELARLPQRDELATAALLHDVGKARARRALREPHLEGPTSARRETPDERARSERRELGIDHALVGAVLVRRWGLPTVIAARRSSATTPRTPTATPPRSGSPT